MRMRVLCKVVYLLKAEKWRLGSPWGRDAGAGDGSSTELSPALDVCIKSSPALLDAEGESVLAAAQGCSLLWLVRL